MREERRKGRRRPIEDGIEIHDGTDSPVDASGVNISRYGALLNTDVPMETASEVSVRIDIPTPPGTRTFRFKGLVVRSDRSTHGNSQRFDTGISFTSVPEEAEETLDEYVNSFDLSSGDEQTLEIPDY